MQVHHGPALQPFDQHEQPQQRHAVPGHWLEQAAEIASRVVAGDMQDAMADLPPDARALVEPLARQALGMSGICRGA